MCMWNISIFFLYNWYCMIDHDIMIDAGPCSRGRAQTQAFPSKCLDESFAFQCVNLVPQAYHTSHSAPLNRRDHAGAAMFMRSTPGCGIRQAPASSGWPFGRQDRTDSQKVQVWSGPARLEDQKCLEAASWRGRVQLKTYDMHIPDIYLSYTAAQ